MRRVLVPATGALLVLVGAVRCGSWFDEGPPRSAWSGEGLGGELSAPTIQLDRMEATYVLPAGNRAPDQASRATWTLGEPKPGPSGGSADHGDEHDSPGSSAWWLVELPFSVPLVERRFAPEGMRVVVDGAEAVFTAGSSERAAHLWRFQGERLAISGARPNSIVVEHPGLLDVLDTMEWGPVQATGATAEAFVRRGISLGKESREGLFLPAPAEAVWASVTLPPGARFEASLGLAPTPVPSQSDGADAVLVLRTEAGDVELTRAHVGPGDRFVAWDADLSAHAGKQGSLVLRTLPLGTTVDDYVFVASPTLVGTPERPVRRVVVIGVDTLRPDHLGLYGYTRTTSPEIDAWARKHAVTFDRAWTSAPRTRPSFRSATTGRDPLEAVCAKNIGEVFDEHGFATAGIVANVHLNPRFDFQQGFDWWHLDGEAKVDAQLAMAKDWLSSHQHRDSYLFLHIMDPHIFYVAPPPFRTMFTDTLPPLPEGEELPLRFNRGDMYRKMSRGKLSELQQQHVVARYDAEVAYLSANLGPFLEWIATLPGRTTVVVHSDHGEEFWEHGGFEHNHTLYDDTTRGVLLIQPPGGTGGTEGARSTALATLQDIAPTLYELAGITDPPPTDGESLVGALRGADSSEDRPIPLGHLQYDAERWGVVWNHHKYVLFTGTGEQELYDLRTDPKEQHNLARVTDTAPWVTKLAEVHRTDVGRGWRVQVELQDCQEVQLELPAQALRAGVLDPESVSRSPVNQEWGEIPPVVAEEVGEVTLSEDGRTVRIVGGPKGVGVVYVLFASEVPVEGASATIGGQKEALVRGAMRVGRSTLLAEEGVVIVPPKSELVRMQECMTLGAGSASEFSALEALGYVENNAPQRLARGRKRAEVLPAAQRCATATGAD